MNVYPVETGFFKLDGGAMFGVVPKTIWQKTNPADSNNLCNWAMRCWLIEDGDRLILVDTGIGDKQSEKFFSHYHLNGDANLIKSIKNLGFGAEDITDVILTHLHFDHVGGAVYRNEDKYQLTFPNAKYWSNRKHWEWAVNQNPREKASFLSENMLPIEASGHLNFIETGLEFGNDVEFFFANGHTESQMIPILNYKNRKVAFCADLFPSLGHLKLPYVPSYDTRPLLSMQEKETFLNKAIEEDIILFFEHDAYNECCTVYQSERGIKSKEVFKLNDI